MAKGSCCPYIVVVLLLISAFNRQHRADNNNSREFPTFVMENVHYDKTEGQMTLTLVYERHCES